MSDSWGIKIRTLRTEEWRMGESSDISSPILVPFLMHFRPSFALSGCAWTP